MAALVQDLVQRLPRRRLVAAFEAGKKEIGAVAAVLVAVVGILVFLGMTDSVTDGHTVRFDEGIMLALRHPGDLATPIGPAWLKAAAIDVTAFGSITDLAIIIVIVGGFFVALRHWRQATLLVLSAVSGLLVVNVFKLAVGRTRPPLAMHAVVATNASFPSGHATLSAVVYLSLAALIAHFAGRRRVRLYALGAGFTLTLIVGLSRVYLGVHWPTDVMAGWALGAGWAMLWWVIAWGVEHRRRRRLLRAGVSRPAP